MIFKERVRKYTVDRKNINWSDRITQVECILPNQCMWMKKELIIRRWSSSYWGHLSVSLTEK